MQDVSWIRENADWTKGYQPPRTGMAKDSGYEHLYNVSLTHI